MDSKEFINSIALKLGMEPETVKTMSRQLCGLICESVKNGDQVAIPAFGTFEPKMRMERITTHPSTGKKILVPPRLTMAFKPAAQLKNKINNPRNDE